MFPHLSTFLALALLASGCSVPRAIRGGRAVTMPKPGGGVEQLLLQGENPAQVSRQSQETIRTRTYTLPPGSGYDRSAMYQAPQLHCSISPSPPPLPCPVPVIEREETRAAVELGTAQKDTARDLGTRLASLTGVVWAGVALFLFGLASFAWPPLRAIVGSVTTSAAMVLGGLALMILPSLVVGHELMILGVVALAVGAWFVAHRHGVLRGLTQRTQNQQRSHAKDAK